MECPYCNAELEWEDSYGTAEYIIYGNEKYKNGDIYKCPNHEGFETKEEALSYDDTCEEDIWEYIACESGVFNGYFYTDKQGDLHEGYPC